MSSKETGKYTNGLAATLKALQAQNKEIDRLLAKIDILISIQKTAKVEPRRRWSYGLIKAASWTAYAFTLYRLVIFIMIQLDTQLLDILLLFLSDLEQCLYLFTSH
jgi:hypothetical protein